MATNSDISHEDTDMVECDGEKVVTMVDVLKGQEDFEEDANAVLGASDEKNCTYSKGYIKRQALYACMTCCAEAKEDPTKRAGICLACSLTCHENHDLIELYTKRNFRCDCGNPKFTSHPCQFTASKNDLNEDNHYNQNFSGLYCICSRPYPDPESTNDDDMIQCVICEDWHHAKHLEAVVPANDQYSEMVCKGCMDKNLFLLDYSHLAICSDNANVDIKNEDLLQNVEIILQNEKETTVVTNINSDVDITNEKTEVNIKSIKKVTSEKDGEQTIDKNESNNIESEEIKNTESQISSTDRNGTIMEDKDNNLEEYPHSDTDNNKTTLDELHNMHTKLDEVTQPIIKNELANESKNENELSLNKKSTVLGSINSVDVTISQKEMELKAEQMEEDRLLADPSPEVEEKRHSVKINNKSEKTVEISESIKDEQFERKLIDNHETINSTKTCLDIEQFEKAPKERENIEKHDLLADKSIGESNISNVIIDTMNIQPEKTNSDCSDSKEHNTPQENAKVIVGVQENMTTSHSEEKVIGSLGNEEPDKHHLAKDEHDKQQVVADTKDVTANIVTEDIEMDSSIMESNQDTKLADIDTSDSNLSENTLLKVEMNTLDHKRKLYTDDSPESTCVKKPKLNDLELCIRPKGIKKIHTGATFWPSNFRTKLCTCNECHTMYNDLSVLFLIDLEDTVTAYENLGKEKVRIEGRQSQYEKGLEALSSLDRIQQINAVTEYNNLRDKLLDFLKSFKDRQAVVKEEDIRAFFAGMKPKRESDGVYFCR